MKVNIRFTAHDLYPNVTVNYDQKFPPLGETKATDINKVLEEYLPSCEWLLHNNVMRVC